MHSIFGFQQLSIPCASEAGGIDLSFFMWVVIIGAIAIIVLYGVKRYAEYLSDKKTEEIIRKVGGKDQNSDSDSK